MRLHSLGKLALVCSAAFSAGAGAVILPSDGTYVYLPGTSILAEPNLAGTTIAASTTPFMFTIYGFGGIGTSVPVGTITGTLDSLVIREDSTGTLDFYWQVLNTSTSSPVFQITDVELGHFFASQYDANWRSDLPGDISVLSAGSGAPGAPEPGSITFNFYACLQSCFTGQASNYFFLHTDAEEYAATALMRIDSSGPGITAGSSGSIVTFAPAVPEPSTYLFLLSGLGAMGVIRRWRGAPRPN